METRLGDRSALDILSEIETGEISSLRESGPIEWGEIVAVLFGLWAWDRGIDGLAFFVAAGLCWHRILWYFERRKQRERDEGYRVKLLERLREDSDETENLRDRVARLTGAEASNALHKIEQLDRKLRRRNEERRKVEGEQRRKVKRAQELRSRNTVDSLKKLDPRQFEFKVAELYRAMGYVAGVTPASSDGGKDIIATKKDEKLYIEVKRYTVSQVGRPIIQQIYGVAHGEGAKPVVVTTGRLTTEAWQWAKGRVQIIQAQQLAKLFDEHRINLLS